MDTSSNASDQPKKIVQYFGKVIYIDDEVHDYQKSGSDGGRKIIGRLDYNKLSNKSQAEKDDKVTLHAVKVVPLDKKFPFFVPARSDIIELSKSLLGHISSSTNIEYDKSNKPRSKSKRKKKGKADQHVAKVTDEDIAECNKLLERLISSHTIVEGRYRRSAW